MLAWLHHDFRNSHGCCWHLCAMLCQGAGVGEECMCIQARACTPVIFLQHTQRASQSNLPLPPSCGPSSRSKGEATGKSGDTDTGVDHEMSFKESVESC